LLYENFISTNNKLGEKTALEELCFYWDSDLQSPHVMGDN